MASYSTSIEILASRESIWPILMDFGRWSEWTKSIAGIEAIDGNPVSIGSKWRITQPKLAPAVWTITAIDEYQSFTWGSSGPGVKFEALHRLESTPSGTLLTLGIETRGPLSWLLALIYGKLTQTYIEMEAAGLKKRCESP